MKKILLLTIAVSTTLSLAAQGINQTIKKTNTMKKFELPVLPYAANALAPTISEETISFHHGKHLLAYINNLNTLKEGTEFDSMTLEEIVKKSKGPLFNNAAQAYNHEVYFNTFSPNPQMAPTGKLLAAIEKQWGSLDNFKKEFVTAGTGIFGSGWVWLASDANGNLSIIKSPNAENPLIQSLTPLLGFDVWEHSYYLDYQNRRADHLNDLWKITDWKVIEKRYK